MHLSRFLFIAAFAAIFGVTAIPQAMAVEKVESMPIEGRVILDGHDTYCYELRIPFSAIGGNIAEAVPSKNRKVAVGVEVGGLTSAEREMIRSVKRERGDDIDKRPSGITGGTFGARRGGTGEAGSQSLEDRWKLDPEIHWLVLTLAPPS